MEKYQSNLKQKTGNKDLSLEHSFQKLRMNEKSIDSDIMQTIQCLAVKTLVKEVNSLESMLQTSLLFLMLFPFHAIVY